MTEPARLAGKRALVTGGLDILASNAGVEHFGVLESGEIAAVAGFLLSPEASYLTGATIDASGGWM
jgi:NAD(P)-dependent dehydrogenase (short-subunit alcohol dehydrogenase family)